MYPYGLITSKYKVDFCYYIFKNTLQDKVILRRDFSVTSVL